MKIFTALYDKALIWSRHRRAPSILAGVSFAESVIFPIPVDVMLAPMAIAQPSKAYYFAFLTSLFSVLGGIAGYLLGLIAFEPLVLPALEYFGNVGTFETAQQWFNDWGFWVIFLAGFSPIPYKVFTVTAGVMSIAFLPFVIASIIGRSMRFFLVAWLMRWGGPIMEKHLRQHLDTIGWVIVALAVIVYLLIR
ncbi:MAG: DedA family protein [Aliidiomarina sp.]|uniref:YqaA family protein n=1 Tax=Aliidiomarina sp. TaxID=1872439 RepID=UPI0025BFAFF5|nr:YqaA family protein [Aliidiomarina sp.]MCH8501772.1 DedA family protein [Aliidiomarina sp.]